MLLKDAIYPLKSLKEFYSLIFLIHNSDNDNDLVSESFNELFDTNFNAESIRLLHSKFIYLFSNDHCDLGTLFSKLTLKAGNKKTFYFHQ